MKRHNNLLVNGKKLALTALLAIALMPNAKAENVQKNVNNAEKQPKEITTKDQLKTAGEILLTFAVMYGALLVFVPGAIKENELKMKAMRDYAEKQKANQK